ncbi:MAG: rod shape-determining protein MreD [Hyphomicrobiaceae bacterium]|nr:rod shape-determining protein MreD [Hyphomicrobiaceae bacterium]
MNVLRIVVPSLTLVVGTLIAALPWGTGFDARLVAPLLVAAMLFSWNVRRRSAVPEWIAFACGLTMDVTGQGPLGYWAMIYLLAFVLAALFRETRRASSENGSTQRFLRYLVAVIALALTAWGLASLYALERVDVVAPALAALISSLAYPFVAGFIGVLEPNAQDDGVRSLVRGG